MLDGSTGGHTCFWTMTVFDIRLVSTSDPVKDPGDLERISCRQPMPDGLPISSFATLTERAVAPELQRESQMRAVPITARTDARSGDG